jgi:phosphoribosylformylglycinamidine synthase
LLEDVNQRAGSAFPEGGLKVFLLGGDAWHPRASDLAGSEYLSALHGRVAGRPAINLVREKAVQQLCRRAIREGVIASAHDCSDGGLAVTLAECAILGGVGFRGGEALARLPRRWDVVLFGEAPSRIVVSLAPEQQINLARLAGELQVPLLELGVTGGSRLQLGSRLDLAVAEIADAWDNGLERALGSAGAG